MDSHLISLSPIYDIFYLSYTLHTIFIYYRIPRQDSNLHPIEFISSLLLTNTATGE